MEQSVELQTLKSGDRFRYDTPDVMASFSEHEVISTEGTHVKIRPFCSDMMTSVREKTTKVFLVPGKDKV